MTLGLVGPACFCASLSTQTKPGPALPSLFGCGMKTLRRRDDRDGAWLSVDGAFRQAMATINRKRNLWMAKRVLAAAVADKYQRKRPEQLGTACWRCGDSSRQGSVRGGSG